MSETMKRVDNFTVLSEMFRRNMKAKLFPMQNFVGANFKKGFGGHVTMGVDQETILRMMEGAKFAGGLILADAEEFDKLRVEMQSASDAEHPGDA